MYVSKSKTNYGTHYISISKGVRNPETKKVKKIMIKSFGTHNLESKEGKEALKLAEKELEEMIKFEKSAKGFENFQDFVANQELTLHHKNIGYLPYLSIYKELKLPTFFNRLTKDSKLDYKFDDMIFYQVLGRLFTPSSKLEVTKRKNDFLYDFNFVNKDNIYSSLDVFSGFNKHQSKELSEKCSVINDMNALLTTVDEESKKILEANIDRTRIEIEDMTKSYDETFEQAENKLFKHLNKSIEKIIPNRNMSLAFYDCTTYYFESFTEDELRERGMSKDNKRNETQVVMGLLIDGEGIPISYKLFTGNEHELHTMGKVIEDVLQNYKIKDIIIVTDRGLNSKDNLKMIREKGLNYIVGSKSTSVPDKMKEKKFDLTWEITSKKEAKHKSGYITDTRIAIHKDEKYKELIIKKYSDLYKEREIFKQEKMDEEKIKAEQENFGYFYIITNKLDMDPVAVMKAYRSLYKIEESFQILKTNLEERPVYRFKSRRIRSHFLICYIALVLQRLLEYKLSKEDIKLSTHELMNGLSDFILDEIDYKTDKLYMISDKLFESDLNKKIFKFEHNVLFSDVIEKSLKKML